MKNNNKNNYAPYSAEDRRHLCAPFKYKILTKNKAELNIQKYENNNILSVSYLLMSQRSKNE